MNITPALAMSLAVLSVWGVPSEVHAKPANTIHFQESQELPPVKQWPHWFDPETGRVRDIHKTNPGVELQTGTSSSGRTDAAAMREVTKTDWQYPKWWQDFSAWFGNLFQNFGTTGLLTLLVVLGVAFLALMFYIVSRTKWGQRLVAKRTKAARRRRPVTREELPFEFEAAQLTIDGLWDRANQARQQGDFRRALMFLYSFLLIELDSHQLIRLSRGKTNRTYAGELRGIMAVLPVFTATMESFERVFFGRGELPEQHVDDLFNRVRQLEL